MGNYVAKATFVKGKVGGRSKWGKAKGMKGEKYFPVNKRAKRVLGRKKSVAKDDLKKLFDPKKSYVFFEYTSVKEGRLNWETMKPLA